MIERPIWMNRLDSAWRQAPLVWLTGVRRAGKTVLSRSLNEGYYVNCDLPSSAERLRDPESFFRSLEEPLVIFDEVHQLADPSRILKIATDAFPELRVLATGSSTLAATQKFRDSLTGRKRTVHLTPVLFEELESFGIRDLDRRLLRGGLPPALLGDAPSPEFYGEWMDSYYARDVQELFRLAKRTEFLRLLEIVFRQSGGLLEVTSLSKHAGVTRPTIMNWLEVLQVTHAIHLLRPYAGGGRRELLAQPKLYAFDTGFVCYARGWDTLRADDRGPLWEHLVLDILLSIPLRSVHFWRDKQKREVDFVLPRGREFVDAIECKWQADAFDGHSLKTFRTAYPKGRNFVVSPQVALSYKRRVKGMLIEYIPAAKLRETLASH